MKNVSPTGHDFPDPPGEKNLKNLVYHFLLGNSTVGGFRGFKLMEIHFRNLFFFQVHCFFLCFFNGFSEKSS